MSDYETLQIERTGSVARVFLHRPKSRNAMNRQMVQDLLDYFQKIAEDRSLRLVILGGSGPAFCSGGDIKEMQQTQGEDRQSQLSAVHNLDAMLSAVQAAPQVVVSRIHGATLGGGVGLLCACDMAVLAHEAIIGLPEVQLGLVPAVISPYVLGRIGLAKSRELMLTGARLNGKAALSAGFGTVACPLDDIDTEVNKLAQAVLKASPSALAAAKALIWTVYHQTPAQTAEYRLDLINQLRASPDGQEGMLAFIQKRQANWVEEV